METINPPPLTAYSSPPTNSKKKLFLIILICFFVVIVLIVIFTILNRKSNQTFNPVSDSSRNVNSTNNTTSLTSKKTGQTTNLLPSGADSSLPTPPQQKLRQDVSSLLIKKNDMEAMRLDYENKLRKAGLPIPTPAQFKFTFKLSPELKKPQSFHHPFPARTVLAANACSLVGLPGTLSMYTLQTHLSETLANKEAKVFAFDPPPYSAGADAGTFTYQYQDLSTDNPRYFNIIESSGIYKFHNAATPSGAVVDEAKAKMNAENQLLLLGLNSFYTLKNIDSTSANYYILDYQKKMDGLIITDKEVLKSIPATKSVCDMEKGDFTSLMNFINIQISKKDGIISNFVNSTRTVLVKKTVARQSLEKSLADYSDPNGITPIIITQGGATGGTVIVDEAYVAYYDLGGMAPQTAYIPMYITSGKVGTTRVFSIFPAISKTDIPEDKSSFNLSTAVKQSSVNFEQPIPPTPVITPGSGTVTCPANMTEYGTCRTCPGGQIDRFKSCVCNGISKTFPMEGINSSACPATCTQKETTETIGGESCTCTVRDCPC